LYEFLFLSKVLNQTFVSYYPGRHIYVLTTLKNGHIWNNIGFIFGFEKKNNIEIPTLIQPCSFNIGTFKFQYHFNAETKKRRSRRQRHRFTGRSLRHTPTTSAGHSEDTKPALGEDTVAAKEDEGNAISETIRNIRWPNGN
jgi:hypothetical protein